MSRTSSRRRTSQAGFTLIELLVVVLIIGVLAAIAIPAFLGQKRGAFDANAKSILRNGAIALETYYEEQNGTFTGADAAQLALIESAYTWRDPSYASIPLAQKNELKIATVNAQGHIIETQSGSGRMYRFDRDYTRIPTVLKTCTESDGVTACQSW